MKITHWSHPSFKSKKQLVEKIRSIANTSPLRTALIGDDAVFVAWVLSHHHDFKNKSGCGIRHIEVRINNSKYGTTRGFWIVHNDNTAIDVSWVIAVDGKSSNAKNATTAARFAVLEQRDTFRNHTLSFNTPCVLCGDALSVSNSHVDHAHPYTFDMLFKCFALEHGVAIDDIETCDDPIDTTMLKFKDTTIEHAWREYHRTHARLRLIHAHENMTLGNRGSL